MLFVVVFGLAALAAAEPEIQQQIQLEQSVAQVQQQPIQHHQQQQVETPNAIPLYKQVLSPATLGGHGNQRFFPYHEEMNEKDLIWRGMYPTALSSRFREERFYPYSEEMKDPIWREDHPSQLNLRNNQRLLENYEEMKENYPFLDYNKNIKTYPYRSNYFLRYMNKPEMGVAQPKVDYDSQDIYHLHGVKHQHMVNNVHDFQQKHIIRNLDQYTDSPYLPYSPMYYNKMNMFNRGYPYVNKPYSRSLEQDYIYPRTYNYYNRYWDMDNIRNNDENLNTEIKRPYMYRNWFEPSLYRKMNYGRNYEQPATTSDDFSIEYIKKANNLNIEDIVMGTVHPLNRVYPYGSKQYSKSLELDYVQPWFNRYVPASSRIAKGFGVVGGNYIHPITTKNQDIDYIHPTTTKNQDIDYIHPTTINTHNIDYVQPASSMENHDTEHTQTTRNLVVLDGNHAELNRGTPTTDLRHSTATNVEPSHQTPVVSEHHEVATHQQIAQEGRRQDIQLSTNVNAEANIQSEDHISQKPIHRQARATTTQIVHLPQYTFNPNYLHPYYRSYLPIQPAPLVTRSAFNPYLPYYYDLLLRK